MTWEVSCALLCKHQDFLSKQQLPVSETRVVLFVGTLRSWSCSVISAPRLRQCSPFPSKKRLLVHDSFHSMAHLIPYTRTKETAKFTLPLSPVRGSAWVWATPETAVPSERALPSHLIRTSTKSPVGTRSRTNSGLQLLERHTVYPAVT